MNAGTQQTTSVLLATVPFQTLTGLGIVAGDAGLNTDMRTPHDAYDIRPSRKYERGETFP